jgi:3-oxoadipate enol-lactonase
VSTVVLSGSLGSTAAMWDPQLPALREHEVIAVEHPGHGGAPVSDAQSVDDLAAHVLETVDADTFSFVGLSLGGAVGMRLALDAPERIDRLVLACTAPRFGEPAGWEERAATVRARGLAPVADLVLPRWFTPAFDDVERYRAMMLSIDPEGYARCCELLARFDVEAELAAISVPTLVISGAEDPTTPPATGAAIASRIPGARHEVIDVAAHLANVERPDAFNQLLKEHL